MAQRVKFPVFEALKFTYRWTLTVLHKHWIVALIYAVGTLVWNYAGLILLGDVVESGQPPTAMAFVKIYGLNAIEGFAFIYLALLTHNEVLRGSGGFNAATMGPLGIRGLTYLFDSLILFLAAVILVVLSGAVIASIVALLRNGSASTLVGVVGVVAIWLVGIGVVTRLSLRLPSRSIGQPMPWSDVWRLGRGNTLRLVGGTLLLSLAMLAAVIVVALPVQLLFGSFSATDMHVVSQTKSTPLGPLHLEMRSFETPGMPFIPALINGLLSGIMSVIGAIALAAYVSLAFAYLRQVSEDAPSAPLLDRDPNEPPEDF
ncbi:hypothetical protein [Xanthobacter flavus]|uniref:hypothetical protein n=1 Tax=Xanthobacter flavus TaxID=281 RepID=UPI00372C7DA6